jgi:hypothetical protein
MNLERNSKESKEEEGVPPELSYFDANEATKKKAAYLKKKPLSNVLRYFDWDPRTKVFRRPHPPVSAARH